MKFNITFRESKQNLSIAVPVALSQLGHMAVAVADTIMAGRLGALPLAAATLAMSLFIPFLMIAIGISYGLTPAVAIAEGEKDELKIVRILKNGFILNLGIGLILFSLLLITSLLFGYINEDMAIVKLAKPFFLIQALSLLPLVFFIVIKQFSEGLALTHIATVITIVANVINIGLIYIFTQGTWGLPQLGLNGIGYATLIARTFMMISMLGYFLFHPHFKVYRKLWNSSKTSLKEMYRLLGDSLPIGLQLMLESGAFGFAAIMAGWIGAKEIAAHQISLNIAAITYMAATGIASATTVRVGHELGRKDFVNLRVAANTALALILCYELLSCLFFIVFKEVLPLAYIGEKDILILSASLLMITALFQVSDGIQVVAMGALRGIGDVRTPTIVAIFSYWVIGLPVGYVFAFVFDLGVSGIWYGLLIGLSISAILLTIRLHRKIKSIALN